MVFLFFCNLMILRFRYLPVLLYWLNLGTYLEIARDIASVIACRGSSISNMDKFLSGVTLLRYTASSPLEFVATGGPEVVAELALIQDPKRNAIATDLKSEPDGGMIAIVGDGQGPPPPFSSHSLESAKHKFRHV